MLFPISIHSKSRYFPCFGWAWPTAQSEQLLRAAALKDETRAKQIFKEWMINNNIDEVSWKEQRLLLPIAARFNEKDVSVPNRARLNGLVRMFWTRSRLSLRASQPAIQKLTSAGIEVLLFKGAAKAASSQDNMKGRIISDVDIAVRPSEFKRAIQILCEDGWETKNGRSLPYAQTLADGLVGLNFIKGEFGDIDLHQSLFRILGEEQKLDEGIWDRSSLVEFLDTQVRIPSITDTLLIAIAHGSVDGHRHSDWVVDCDRAVSSNNIDWNLFIEIVTKRNLAPHAAIVLSFLSHRLQSKIPEDVLEKIGSLGKQSLPNLFSALFQARPLSDLSTVTNIGRSIFKQARIRKKRKNTKLSNRKASSVIKMRGAGKLKFDSSKIVEKDYSFKFDVPPGTKGLTIIINASINVKKRRCVYELNTSNLHVARFIYRHSGSKGQYLIKAKIALPTELMTTQSHQMTFEARPRKILVLGEEPEKKDALNKVPFSVHSIDFW